MPGFKAQARRDLKAAFHNEREHADKTEVRYNGENYSIPIVVDSEGARERKRLANDNADGVFVADMTAYISFYDLGIVPRKETEIVIDDATYNIVRVGFDAGEIALDLEVLDE
jgi:hypothetical protein